MAALSYITIITVLARAALAEYSAESGTTGDSNAASAQQSSEEAEEAAEELLNLQLVNILGLIWLATIGVVAAYRFLVFIHTYIRKIVCLTNDKQHYFARPHALYAFIRKHVLEAPLFRKRHNKGIAISSTINAGAVPTRLQMFSIVGYYAVNIVFLATMNNYAAGSEAVVDQVFVRSGWLSSFNLILLFLLAGRNNILIRILDVPYDSMNLFHRWLGRLAVAQGAVHSFIYIDKVIAKGGFEAFLKKLQTSTTILTGTIALGAFLALILHSPSLIRHAYYEFFLCAHILLAITAIVALWYHYSVTQYYIIPVIVIWVSDRLIRTFTLMRRNVGAGGTMAEVEVMPGEAMRVTLHVARPWKFNTGQHVFLYVPKIGWWTNHPFSVAWSDESRKYSDHNEKMYMSRMDISSVQKTTMSLIIRRRTGFTDKLYKAALKAPSGRLIARAFVDGPYGGHDLSSYGTVLLFAAGVGITHQVPFLRSLVAKYNEGTCATRRIVLIWIVQSPEHLEWIRPWMTEILGMEGRRDVLKGLLFITRPRSTKEITSPSNSVQMFPGKPNVDALIAQQQKTQVGTMAVSVCGTGSLGDDVRASVRKRCQSTAIELVETAFTW